MNSREKKNTNEKVAPFLPKNSSFDFNEHLFVIPGSFLVLFIFKVNVRN